MNYLSLIGLVCVAAALVDASETGYYVPKGYYVIHSDGQQSELAKISPSHQLLLHRLRRSAQFSLSSSSASSSVSSNGGPVSFHQSSSSQVSPGGFSSQGYNGVVGSLNTRFNGDYDDDYYDDGPVPFNSHNQRPYSSSQVSTGGYVSNGFNGPSYTSSQTQTGNAFPSRLNVHSSSVNGASSTYINGNPVSSPTSGVYRPTGIQSQSTHVSYPSGNGNAVFTQSNNNGVRTESSGVILPNGQVQITSHKTGRF